MSDRLPRHSGCEDVGNGGNEELAAHHNVDPASRQQKATRAVRLRRSPDSGGDVARCTVERRAILDQARDAVSAVSRQPDRLSTIPGAAERGGSRRSRPAAEVPPPMYRSAMRVPLLGRSARTSPLVIPRTAPRADPPPADRLPQRRRTGLDRRPRATPSSALGANGRSCGTCHQPSQGMGLGAAAVRHRFRLSGAEGDPLFAPVDGADCPNRVPASETRSPRPPADRQGRAAPTSAAARSLLLRYGLFRVFLPVPAGADYTVSIAPGDDPTGCNTDPPTRGTRPTPRRGSSRSTGGR